MVSHLQTAEASARNLWPNACKAAGLPKSDWRLTLLHQRNDAGIAGCAMLAESELGTKLCFKHSLRPKNSDNYQSQFTHHLKSYDSFPHLTGYAVSKPLYLDKEQQVSIYEFAKGQNLRDYLTYDSPSQKSQLEVLETAGRWLDHYHRARPTEFRRFSPTWAVNRYCEIRKSIVSGKLGVPAPDLFLKGVSRIEEEATKLSGLETVACIQHGDFHMANLIWDGKILTGIDISAGHLAPVGHDVNKFLVDYVRRFRPASDVRKGQVLPPDVREAFFSGYTLVGPDDPTVRLFSHTQLLELWMKIPKRQKDRTKAKQLCLQQIKPIAKKAFEKSR
ncbi:MAG: phosphotransferase [Marinovum sp.]|nr:phosphotransferase [Marinovum sp.]